LNPVNRLTQLHVAVVLIVAVIYSFILRGNGAPWMWVALWTVGFGLTAGAPIRPELGLAAYVVTVYSTPRYERLFDVLFGSNLLHVVTFFAISGGALWLARNARKPRFDSPALLLAVGLFAWGCVSALLATPDVFHAAQSSQNPRHSPVLFLHALLLLVVASQVMDDRVASRWFVLPVAIGLTIRVLWQGPPGLRLEGDIGPLLAMLVPLFVLLVQVDSIRSIKLLMAIAALGAVAATAFTYNRASVVVLSVVSLLIFWRYRRNPWIVVTTVICVAAAVFWISSSPYRGRFQEVGNELRGSSLGSVSERLQLWRAGFAIAVKHPVIGIGPANYPSEIGGYDRNLQGLEAHNSYVHMAAETGFVGLVLYLALFGTVLWATWRTFRRSPQHWRGATVAAIQISIVAYLTGGLFISRHDMVLAYLLVGWAAALTSAPALPPSSAAGSASESRRDSPDSGRL
jgi:O-antigen ligase